MAAVQQQLTELNAEAKELSKELKEAYQALEGAELGTSVHAARQQRYEDLKNAKKDLDQMRKDMQAQLSAVTAQRDAGAAGSPPRYAPSADGWVHFRAPRPFWTFPRPVAISDKIK